MNQQKNEKKRGIQLALHAIVLDALSRDLGDVLITNGEIQERTGVGAGTIQRAYDLLADRGALKTTSRGHMGRRLDSIEVGECWQAAGLGRVRFVLSSGLPIEQRILEEVLARELSDLGVPHTFVHKSGGNERLRGVSDGEYDVAIVSIGTLEGAKEKLGLTGLGAERRYGAGTYYSPERLVVLEGPNDKNSSSATTVAIDTSSFDHEILTEAQFPASANLEYVEMPFAQVPARILAGLVSTGVWHISAMPIPFFLTDLRVSPLSEERFKPILNTVTGAAAVAWSGRPELKAILKALNLNGLLEEQQAEIRQERLVQEEIREAIRAE